MQNTWTPEKHCRCVACSQQPRKKPRWQGPASWVWRAQGWRSDVAILWTDSEIPENAKDSPASIWWMIANHVSLGWLDPFLSRHCGVSGRKIYNPRISSCELCQTCELLVPWITGWSEGRKVLPAHWILSMLVVSYSWYGYGQQVLDPSTEPTKLRWST